MIPVKNIYYMLSYAFQVLNEQGYRDMAAEDFDNAAELCAAVLLKGVSAQLKRGLGREYITKEEPLSLLRGKLEISESVKIQSMLRKQMVCSYDDFSVDSYINRIIKTTMLLLLRSDISKSRKKELRKLLVFFDDVGTLDLYTIDWNVYYDRNNQTYRMLISICELVIKGLLQTNSDGSVSLMDFEDSQGMSHLYEKFILEYFRKNFPQIHVSASQIPWALDDKKTELLPIMQSDIMLSYQDTVLIIDAKYYAEHTTQIRYDAHTVYSGNLYQIFTYVKNKDAEFAGKPHTVSGMLLYARTDEIIQPDQTYQMHGNRIDVQTLDLNCDFAEIADQLDQIVGDFFKIQIGCT